MRKILALLIFFSGIMLFNARAIDFERINSGVQDTILQKYPRQLGNIRIEANYVNMGLVHKNERKAFEIGYFNSSKDTVLLSVLRAPLFISAKIENNQILPGEEGNIIITYDGSRNNKWGNETDRLYLNVDNATYGINVMATIIDDFSHLSDDDLKNAPSIAVEKTEFDFGTIKQGERVRDKFTLMNNGSEVLLIRDVKTSCDCIRLHAEREVLPGESVDVHFLFSSAGLRLRQSFNIAVITNDPQNPVLNLQLVGMVRN